MKVSLVLLLASVLSVSFATLTSYDSDEIASISRQSSCLAQKSDLRDAEKEVEEEDYSFIFYSNQLSRARNSLSDVEDTFGTVAALVTSSRKKIRAITANKKELKGEIKALKVSLKEDGADQTTISAELSVKYAELATIVDDLADAKVSLDSAKKLFADLKPKLQALQAETKSAYKSFNVAKRSIIKAEKMLEKAKARLAKCLGTSL